MKTIRIVLYLLIISLIIITDAYGSEITIKRDSLVQELARTTKSNERLTLLEKISFLMLDNPEGVQWLYQLKDEAQENNKPEVEDWAIRYLTRFYYNAAQKDSVELYAFKSDSLAKSINHYSDYFYDSQTFLCQFLLWQGQLEKASDIAIRLYNQAKEDDSENGIICSCETLGLINQRIGQDSIAVHFFTEGMELLSKRKNEHRFLIQFLNNIIESELKLNRFDETHKHLEQLENLIIDIQSGRFGEDNSFPYIRTYILAECYYIQLRVREKNTKEARKHIENIQPIIDQIDDEYVRFYFIFSEANYYKLSGQYGLALNRINQIIKVDPSPEVLKLKAETLFDMGNHTEAALIYKEVIKQNEEMHHEAFVRQLTHLHTLHDMNNLTLQVKELRLKELELNVKQQQLKWTFALILILIIILILGTVVYIHTNKLKNELQKDKKALLKSENELRIARDHAEESERLKSLFLSNMSHEIRTPLNAIVGFSQLLIGEFKENKELKEYANVIIANSELLLNLVNDILDISRLESEKYRFTFAKQNLSECCKHVLTSIQHRVKDGVILKFSAEDESFCLNTDKLRLQQILINLVGNATKFTEKGCIELAYTIDRKAGVVRFTVTDTGCGIPVKKQDTIFERFEKLNECVQGTGLGLSICRIIAERFKGEVILDKSYTKGARFIFTHSLYL